jgi:hypothetical protein
MTVAHGVSQQKGSLARLAHAKHGLGLVGEAHDPMDAPRRSGWRSIVIHDSLFSPCLTGENFMSPTILDAHEYPPGGKVSL